MASIADAGKVFLVVVAILSSSAIASQDQRSLPNILVVIAEDSSWIHYGGYGEGAARTPCFERVAREGVLFNHAYCSEPTCSPSRAAILTGQQFWRLEDASVFGGTLKNKFPAYPVLLEAAGYRAGSTGKAWGPGSWIDGGWKENPGGKTYPGFREFVETVPPGKPFCFWQGTPDAHRPYSRELTLRSGRRPDEVELPPFLPDRLDVRMDMLDYYVEIERFDRLVGQLLDVLDEMKLAEDTIVVVTSDHGMPFARGKANLYDLGVRVPLAIRWPSRIPAGRTIDDFVSLTDLAPTLLEAAHQDVPSVMTGRSLLGLLVSESEGTVDPDRDRAFFGKEMGIGALYGETRLHGLPNRGIRTKRFLYIQNYDIDSMPGFNPVQGGPATEIMKSERDRDPVIARNFALSYGKRPEEELYDSLHDPYQMHNLADDPKHAQAKQRLRTALEEYLRTTTDPRIAGRAEDFMHYPIWYRRGRQPDESVFLVRDDAGELGLESRIEKAE
jgi:uncharacterized sulfatase